MHPVFTGDLMKRVKAECIGSNEATVRILCRRIASFDGQKAPGSVLNWGAQVLGRNRLVQVSCFSFHPTLFDAMSTFSVGEVVVIQNHQVTQDGDFRATPRTIVNAIDPPLGFRLQTFSLHAITSSEFKSTFAMTEPVAFEPIDIPPIYSPRYKCKKCGTFMIESGCPRSCYPEASQLFDIHLNLMTMMKLNGHELRAFITTTALTKLIGVPELDFLQGELYTPLKLAPLLAQVSDTRFHVLISRNKSTYNIDALFTDSDLSKLIDTPGASAAPPAPPAPGPPPAKRTKVPK